MYPRVVINLPHLRENVKILKALCADSGVDITGVTKAFRGAPKIAQAYIDGGLTMLGDSRVANLKRMAEGNKLPFHAKKRSDREYVVTMEVSSPTGDAPKEEAAAACIPDSRGDFVVAVDTAVMGRGSDELGAALMKGFLFAVSQLERLPKTMLFYNGGAKLTVEGSDSLEDLRSMEAQGVEILTCGTCLSHYGLTEKLAVGSVTNMYTIVETLAGAGKVIKP